MPDIPPLFGRGSSEPHLCHGSKPCLLEISPWMDMLWSLYWFLFFSFFWCQFLIVAVTKYHRLSVLIQHKFISQFWRSHVLSQFHWAKIQMLADVPSRSSKGESISFSFHLLGASCIPQLVTPSSVFQASSVASSLFSDICFRSLDLLCSALILLLLHIRTTGIILGSP